MLHRDPTRLTDSLFAGRYPYLYDANSLRIGYAGATNESPSITTVQFPFGAPDAVVGVFPVFACFAYLFNDRHITRPNRDSSFGYRMLISGPRV